MKKHLNSGLFDAFLMKPIDAEELLEVMKRYLPFTSLKRSEPDATGTTDKPQARLSEEEKKRLPELIRILETDFLPLYYEVSKRQRMGQIRSPQTGHQQVRNKYVDGAGMLDLVGADALQSGAFHRFLDDRVGSAC